MTTPGITRSPTSRTPLPFWSANTVTLRVPCAASVAGNSRERRAGTNRFIGIRLEVVPCLAVPAYMRPRVTHVQNHGEDDNARDGPAALRQPEATDMLDIV